MGDLSLEDPDSYELFATFTTTGKVGGTIRTHGPKHCAGTRCVIHNPTDHHMRDWPLRFRAELDYLALRRCPHGQEHPDPDSLDYFIRRQRAYVGVHPCDGCCTPDTAHKEDHV